MVEILNRPEEGCIIDFEKSQTVKPLSAKWFINVFVESQIKKFRHYNSDEFIITLSGLKNFVDLDNGILSFLMSSLKDNGFTVIINGEENHVSEVSVSCRNETKNEGYNYVYQIQCLPFVIDLSAKTEIPVSVIIIMRIIAQTIIKQKVLYKALVFDLDDTLWLGTLAEDGLEKIKNNLRSDDGIPYIAFMDFIKTLSNELGIYVAICSRNDMEIVSSAIDKIDETIFPLKKQIDYIVANFNDKSENLKEIAKQLSILPESMIFIDDNQMIRDEVKEQMPNVFVPEWFNHSDLTTLLIIGCFFERNELSLNSQERRKQYKLLQVERKNNNLPNLLIKAIEDKESCESLRLYAKTNQFIFSQHRNNFGENSQSLYFELYRANGESLGICSAITYSNSFDGECVVLNWAISCRFFCIGLEEFVLLHMSRLCKSRKIKIAFNPTSENLKVNELLKKYPKMFRKNENDDFVEIDFSEDNIKNLEKETNIINMV